MANSAGSYWADRRARDTSRKASQAQLRTRIAPRTYQVVRTRQGGTDQVRRVEYLPNGLYRVDYLSGLVKCFSTDPSESFARGIEPNPAF